MKTKTTSLAAVATAFFAMSAPATTIPVALPTGEFSAVNDGNVVKINFNDLDGMALAGQSVTLDFDFDHYVNVNYPGIQHRANTILIIGFSFAVDGDVTNWSRQALLATDGQFMLDGQALAPKHQSRGFAYGQGGFACDAFAGPYDGQFFAVNGMDFQVTLPNNPELTITNGVLDIFAGSQFTNPESMIIGDRIRPVPDSGTTLGLLALAFLPMLLVGGYRRAPARVGQLHVCHFFFHVP